MRCWLDANGTRIDRFHVSSMACSPSRACFWTGMYAPQQGIYGTFVVGTQFTMDPSIPTIGDLFKELGYRTAFFGKWHLSFPGEPPTNLEAALDTAQGNPLKGYGFDHSAISPPADVGAYNDGYTNDPIWTGQAVNFLREHARRRAAVAVRAEPAQPARHPVLPARVPRRLQAPRLRRRSPSRRSTPSRRSATSRACTQRFRDVVAVDRRHAATGT